MIILSLSRLLSFLPGKTLVSYKLTNDLLFQAGVLVGTVSKQLEVWTCQLIKVIQDILINFTGFIDRKSEGALLHA